MLGGRRGFTVLQRQTSITNLLKLHIRESLLLCDLNCSRKHGI